MRSRRSSARSSGPRRDQRAEPRLPAGRLRRVLPLHGRDRPAPRSAPARFGPPRRPHRARLHRDCRDRLRSVALIREWRTRQAICTAVTRETHRTDGEAHAGVVTRRRSRRPARPRIDATPTTIAARTSTFPSRSCRHVPTAAVGMIASSERGLCVQLRQTEAEGERRDEDDAPATPKVPASTPPARPTRITNTSITGSASLRPPR